MTLPVTAAICTHDRPELLRRALRSLVEQRPGGEILVVDNAPSSTATRDIVAREFPRARYVLEKVPGLDFARNRALRESAMEIVAFLDDDAVAQPGWLAAIAATFEDDPRVGLCTGRVEAFSLESEGQRIVEDNGGYSRGRDRVRLPRDAHRPLHGHRAPLVAWAVSVGSGTSLAVRRDLALRIGGFDEALDMGAALPGGGDHDMLWRILQSGHDVVYEPEAVALHEHRREVEAAYAQIVGHQRALVAVLTKMLVQTRGGRVPLATFLAWRMTKPAVRLVRRAVGRDPLPAPVLLRMWWNCVAGLSAYPRARRLARRRRLRYGGAS